jgi:autotransporter-associated beta strand protein
VPQGNRNVELTGSGNGSIAGGISSNAGGGLIKNGTGAWTLTGANTYSGATTISAGTLQIGNGGTTGTLSSASAITNNGNLVFNRANNVVQGTDFSAAAITGTGNLTQSGTGNLTLNAANSYTGVTTINSGTLIASGGSAIANAGTVTLANTSGALFSITGNETIGSLRGGGSSGGNVTIAASQTLTVAETSSQAFSGSIQGSGGLTKTGAGTLSLDGANTYSGATTVSAGTLQIGNGGTTGTLSSTSAITNNGTLAFNRTNNVVQGTDFSAAAITGTGNLTQGGTGNLTLNGANTYSGVTKINAGMLALGSANAVGATGNITFGGGTLQFSANNTTDYSARFKNSASSIALDTNGQNLNLAAIGNTNTGGFTKSGAGNITFTGTNTYSGDTIVSAGALILSATGGINSSNNVAVADGATFRNDYTTAFTCSTLALTKGAALSGSGGGFTPTALSITADLGSVTGGLVTLNTSLTVSGVFAMTLTTITPGNYDLFMGTGLATLSSVSSLMVNGTNFGGLSGDQGGYTYTLNASSNTLAVTAVPEPSTWALIMISLTTVMFLRRRRAGLTRGNTSQVSCLLGA